MVTVMKAMHSRPEMAGRFRDLYSRCEHALKRSGFLRKDRKDAQADWSAFGQKLGSDFFDEVRKSGKVATLLDHPPRRLQRGSGGPKWPVAEPPPITDVEALFRRGVCVVRANFIHGEKYVGSPNDIARDDELIEQALWTLEQAIGRHKKVRSFF